MCKTGFCFTALRKTQASVASGPCLKTLRFFVKHSFSSSRAARFTLCYEMPASMAHSHHSALASSGACASFSRVAKRASRGFGMVLWFLAVRFRGLGFRA